MNDTVILREIGNALYGEHWEAVLSRQIRVSDRSMRRWANGTDLIPWGVWFDIYREVETRVRNLSDWKAVLYERVVIRTCEQRPAKDFDANKDWLVEVHEPENGRHSLRHSEVVRSLAEVRRVMKEYPGMIFRVIMPYEASENDRQEFSRMNIARI
jgi:hypothetical protein